MASSSGSPPSTAADDGAEPDGARPVPDRDVVVVGAGPAGLSAALVLGRSRRRVLVVDGGPGRNAAAEHVHGFLTRDGTSPAELRRLALAEVRRYGVQVEDGVVEAITAQGPGRLTVLVDGVPVTTRRVIVATGLRDELPDVPGLRERWGRDVVHCPYCHGWELRDRPVAVLVTHPAEAALAVSVTRWAASVVAVLHGTDPDELEPRTRHRLDALGVSLHSGPALGLAVRDDALRGVRTGQEEIPVTALFVQPRLVARHTLLTALGADVRIEAGCEVVQTDPTGRTGVRDVWAVGNLSDPAAQVSRPRPPATGPPSRSTTT